MNTLNVSSPRLRYWEISKIALLALVLWYLWTAMQATNWRTDVTSGYIDPSIWILVLIGLICFILMVALTAWIFLRLWNIIGLPAPRTILSHFKYLESCQKLKFLFAAYALLLLAGVGCLVAIC